MEAFVRTSSQDQNVELMQRPVPEIAKEEVLVNVCAFGVGIHDRYFIPNDAVFPYTIGTEAAGVTVRTAGGVTQFKVGEQVMLTSVLLPKGGCWAEYVAVPQSFLIPMPRHMEYTTAAAIPIAGKTALESMRALALDAGATLFVAGASGAIGTLVIQLATARGIRVIGSASPKNHEYMLSLGAEKAVDYSAPNWKQQVREWTPDGVSAALAIQPGTVEDSIDVVTDGGTVVTVSGDPVPSRRNIAVFQFEHHEDTQQAVAQLASDIAEGRVQIVLEHIYPFDRAIDALRKTETRHARGKIVVTRDRETQSESIL
jgi:NADPH:quinone reductase-like Zn-dependent oxidoreductase